MATTEQFSLRWNNFTSNLTSGFHELLEAAEMVDVTLAVDGHFLQAHKIVLSICSPYFKQMFKVNPCKHPIVILKDVGHENMKDILEFMYMGEVSVLRENLSSFLRTAEVLQVKGLTGDDSSETSSRKDEKLDCDTEEDADILQYNSLMESDVELPPHYPPAQVNSPPPPVLNVPLMPPVISGAKRQSKNGSSNSNSKRAKSDTHVNQFNKPAVKQQTEQEQITPLKPKTDCSNDHIEAINYDKPIEKENEECKEPNRNSWDYGFGTTTADVNSSDQEKCFACGKSMRKSSIRRHMFDVHLPKPKLPCDICHKLFKTANSLATHLITIHNKTKSRHQKGDVYQC